MSKVMDSRSLAVRGGNPALQQKRLYAIGNAGASVGAASPDSIPEQRCAFRRRQFQLGASSKILLDLIRDAGMNREQTRLVELRHPNMQRRVLPVVVAFCKICLLYTSPS